VVDEPFDFEIRAEDADGVHVLAPEGELDLATAPRLAEAFADRPTVLDLTGLQFIDSTGLATLISERRRRTEAGLALVLVRGTAQTQRLFSVTGVENLFAWAPSREDAVAAARDGGQSQT
jgi:anti-sigma B factor antagonist